MSGIGEATAVLDLLNRTLAVIKYVRAVAGANHERQKLLQELVQIRGMISTLNELYEDTADESWNSSISDLGGSLTVFKQLVEEIWKEIGAEGGDDVLRIPLNPAQDNPKQGKIKSMLQNLKWPLTDSKVKEMLVKLEQIKSTILLSLSRDSVELGILIRKEIGNLDEHVKQVHDSVSTMSGTLDIVSSQNDELKRLAVEIKNQMIGNTPLTDEQKQVFQGLADDLSWDTDFVPNHYVQDPITSMLQDPRVRQWIVNGGSLLLTGLPGSGKTTILHGIAAFLRASSNAFIVSLQFDRTSSVVSDIQEIFASIVRAMIKQNSAFKKYYNKLMLTGEGPLETKDSLRIIHRARQDVQRFYLVLNGLDAWNQDAAIEFIAKATSLRDPLAIIATSRYTPIEKHFEQVIDISKQDHTAALRLFVTRQLNELAVLGPEDLEMIAEELMKRSGGMFTWVQLAIDRLKDELKHGISRKRLKAILSESPSSLSAAIERLVVTIANQDEDNAALGWRILQLLTFRSSRLSVSKTLEAVSDIPHRQLRQLTDDQEKAQTCHDACKGLVVIEDNHFQLVHNSIREWLVDHGKDFFPP